MSTPPAGNPSTQDISGTYFLNNNGDMFSDGTGNLRCFYTRLGKATVNLNATGDTSIAISATKYLVLALVVRDSSGTPGVLCAFTLRDAAAGGGNSLAGSLVGLNGAISTSKAGFLQISPTALGSYQQETATTLFINVSVANGSALTATFDIIGIILN